MYHPKHIPRQERDLRRHSGPGGMGNSPVLYRRCQRQCILEAHVLKGSLSSDSYFTKSEIRAMSENWVQVEDDQNIIDSEVDEAIDIF